MSRDGPLPLASPFPIPDNRGLATCVTNQREMALSNRTYACIPCGKTFRIELVRGDYSCPLCGGACESVGLKLRVPSPKNRKRWLRFWEDVREDKRTLLAWYQGELKVDTELKLQRTLIRANARVRSAEKRSEEKWSKQKKRKHAPGKE